MRYLRDKKQIKGLAQVEEIEPAFVMFCRKYIKNRFDKRKKPFAWLKSVKLKDGEKILVF